MSLLDTIFGAGTSSSPIGQSLGGIASGAALNRAIQSVEDLRNQVTGLTSEYATRGAEATAFEPFAVTTGAGTAQFGPAGGLTTTPALSSLTQALQQAAGTAAGGVGTALPEFGQVSQTALQQALSTLGQETPTAESLFAQMQATRTPAQERQRLALENRLQAQGRGGVQTAAYGGTPEELALEKAIQEQLSSDLLSATTLAPQLAQQRTAQASGLFGLGAQAAQQPGALTAQNIQNISGLLTTAAQPEQQLLSALSPALQASQLAQTGRASEAQLLGALGPQMLESITETGAIEAGLEQEQINAILQGLGLQTQGSQVKQAIDMLNSLGISI